MTGPASPGAHRGTGPPPASDGTFALLTDGSTVLIRPAAPQDAGAVRDMHLELSADNVFLRFFSLSSLSADREAQRVCRDPDPGHLALLAWLGDRLVGVASYEPVGRAGTAEIAFAVSDDMHGHGIATLLLEHLVSAARQRGLTAFTATTLLENSAMLGVFADAGLPVQRHLADGMAELTFPLPAGDAEQRLGGYLDSVASRESRADVASLRHLLQPASVAVIGASRRPGTVGHAILHNIVAGGYAGRVYPVNPHGRSMAGLPCVASVADLPEPAELAIMAVPPAAVPGVAADCGRSGVRALTVITSGLGSSGADLLAICRRHGMRLVGPNCFGIAVPGTGLHATFAGTRPVPGVAGLVMQSGGLGVALLEHLTRLGIGVSSFASVGDKYDVSSNDLLTWWEQDGQTRLAILYVESFGSPRKFARTARRVGQRMPVLTLMAGRAAADPSADGLISRDALFGQAGIIVAASLGELVEAAALLACQPLPAGNRVAIVSNDRAAGMLAADACGGNGLAAARLNALTRRRLRRLLPSGAAVTGPVDTTALVSPGSFRNCLEQVAADDGVDAVLAVSVPTAVGDLLAAMTAAVVGKPFAVALLEQAESVRIIRRPASGDPGADGPAADPACAREPSGAGRSGDAGTGPAVDGRPAYAYPECAVRALAHAVRYRAWRDRQQGTIPELGQLRPAEARDLVAGFLAGKPGGGWLPAGPAAGLLSCYQIATFAVPSEAGPKEAQAQRPRTDGVEVRIRVVQEPVFGPVIIFSVGGETAEVLGDHAARLTPLTDADADDLIRSVRAAPLLFGRHGAPPADTAALARLLLQVSRLASDLPEISELDLSPIVASPDGVQVRGMRIRVSPATPGDPFLRRLR